jgi:hypothetical protein
MKPKAAQIQKTAAAATPFRARRLHYALVFLVILLFACIRYRLRDFPLERDEGEYAYMGQLMLQGIAPYSIASNMKLPGTYAAYAALMGLFGQTPAGIHIGFLLINACTTLLVYFLGRRLFGSFAGVVACASYALLSTSPSVLGFAAHASHFVILPALAGMLWLLKAIETGRIWLFSASGFLAGLAFIMKQPGIFFVLFALAYLLCLEMRKQNKDWIGLAARAAAFSLGAAAPFGLTCAILYAAGVFNQFWFWTFSYAQAYGTLTSFGTGMQLFSDSFGSIAGANPFIWLVVALGLAATIIHPSGRDSAGFTIGLLFFSFLAVCPGWYFRTHYFVLMLPAVALLAGAAVETASRFFRERAPALDRVPVLIIIVIFAFSVYRGSEYFFVLTPVDACRTSYGVSSFPASLEIGKYIDNHAKPDATILVLGSEPQIYFYAKRHSATSFIYVYSLMENQPYALTMQQDMIAEAERAHPEYIVLVLDPLSWTRTVQSETTMLRWADKYLAAEYVLEGVADYGASGGPKYLWGAAARTYEPRTQNTIRIFKRRND